MNRMKHLLTHPSSFELGRVITCVLLFTGFLLGWAARYEQTR